MALTKKEIIRQFILSQFPSVQPKFTKSENQSHEIKFQLIVAANKKLHCVLTFRGTENDDVPTCSVLCQEFLWTQRMTSTHISL